MEALEDEILGGNEAIEILEEQRVVEDSPDRFEDDRQSDYEVDEGVGDIPIDEDDGSNDEG